MPNAVKKFKRKKRDDTNKQPDTQMNNFSDDFDLEVSAQPKKSLAQRLGEKLRKIADEMDENGKKETTAYDISQALSQSENDGQSLDYQPAPDDFNFSDDFDSDLNDKFGNSNDFSGNNDFDNAESFYNNAEESMNDFVPTYTEETPANEDIPPIITENTEFGVTPSYDENADTFAEPSYSEPAMRSETDKPEKRRPRDFMGSLKHRLRHEYDDDRKKMGVDISSVENDAPTDQIYTPISRELADAINEFADSENNQPESLAHWYDSDEKTETEQGAETQKNDNEPEIVTAIKRAFKNFVSRLPGFTVKEYVPYTPDDVKIEEDDIPSPSLMADIERYVESRRDMGVTAKDYENMRERIQSVDVNVTQAVRRGTTPQNAYEVYSAENELISMIDQISIQNERQRRQIGVYVMPKDEDPYNYRGINSNRMYEEEDLFSSFSVQPDMSFESENRISSNRADMERQCDAPMQDRPRFACFNAHAAPSSRHSETVDQCDDELYLNSQDDELNDDFEDLSMDFGSDFQLDSNELKYDGQPVYNDNEKGGKNKLFDKLSFRKR